MVVKRKVMLKQWLNFHFAVSNPQKYINELWHWCKMGTCCVPVVEHCLLLNNLISGIWTKYLPHTDPIPAPVHSNGPFPKRTDTHTDTHTHTHGPVQFFYGLTLFSHFSLPLSQSLQSRAPQLHKKAHTVNTAEKAAEKAVNVNNLSLVQ